MNEYVKKLTVSLEPRIEDLDEKLTLLNEKGKTFNEVSNFLNYVHDDINLVGIYADQNLILNSLPNINSNNGEYQASCYLLKSDDSNVKALPQYEDAVSLINKLISYFKESQDKLSKEISELKMICEEKELDKKYFEIFSTENPYVKDIDEFTSFLEKRVEDDNQKINMLLYVINSNMLVYEGKKS